MSEAINMREALRLLHAHRGDEILVTTMGATREWLPFEPHPLDFHYVPSSMGQATAVAMGIALARPDKRVICLNGDGSMLMNLGSLVSIAASGVKNLAVVVFDNGVYEVTGGTATAAARANAAVRATAQGIPVDFATIARGSGFARTERIETIDEWKSYLPQLSSTTGPCLATVRVAQLEDAGAVPIRGPHPERAKLFRQALAES